MNTHREYCCEFSRMDVIAEIGRKPKRVTDMHGNEYSTEVPEYIFFQCPDCKTVRVTNE